MYLIDSYNNRRKATITITMMLGVFVIFVHPDTSFAYTTPSSIANYWKSVQQQNLNGALNIWDTSVARLRHKKVEKQAPTSGVDDCGRVLAAVDAITKEQNKYEEPANPLAGCLNLQATDWSSFTRIASIYDLLVAAGKRARDSIYRAACSAASKILNTPSRIVTGIGRGVSGAIIGKAGGIIGAAGGKVVGGIGRVGGAIVAPVVNPIRTVVGNATRKGGAIINNAGTTMIRRVIP